MRVTFNPLCPGLSPENSLSWHVRLNAQFCLILEGSCQRLIHNACEMALHPTSCAEKKTQTVVFPNTLWLSNDPVLHHFREPTQHLFFQLERPFHFPPWQHEEFAEYLHLQFIDKRRAVWTSRQGVLEDKAHFNSNNKFFLFGCK